MAPPLPPLVVTGAGGFVGRRLLHALRSEPPGSRESVTLLVRPASSLATLGPLPPHWRIVPWSLDGSTPLEAGAMPPGAVVLHLAAATGRLPGAVMRAVNVDGTRRLLEVAAAARAAHLVFVSSIAAGFRNRRWYHYARAKREAEALVRQSGIPATIVRPTMVFGAGSPVQEGLERIATSPLPIVPGTGRVRLQPIDSDDLVRLLLALAATAPRGDTTIEVGGAEQCTLRELLAGMRAARGLPARRPWSVPLGPVRLLLAVAEPVLGRRLPVTAGQLASFLNDSIAAPHPLAAELLPRARPWSALLGGELPSRPGADPALAREFGRFARYLGTRSPDLAAAAAYVGAHASAAAIPADRLDHWLVALARHSGAGCTLADTYARLVRPHGLLRRKLVLALAVLESSGASHADYDTARSSPALSAWMAIFGRGTWWVAQLAIALVLLAPVHLVARLGGDGAGRG